MNTTNTCSSCKKLFDAKDIRNNLCEKCLAVEVWETFKSKMSEQFEINYVVRKHYIGLKKGSKLVTAVRFLRNKLDLDINRGDILLDNSRSKGFFSFDDAKNICKEKSWKYKSGVVGKSYGIQLSKSEEIDYIVYLLKQKYETL